MQVLCNLVITLSLVPQPRKRQVEAVMEQLPIRPVLQLIHPLITVMSLGSNLLQA